MLTVQQNSQGIKCKTGPNELNNLRKEKEIKRNKQMLIRITNFYPENIMTLPANKIPKTNELPVKGKRTGWLEVLSTIKDFIRSPTIFMV